MAAPDGSSSRGASDRGDPSAAEIHDQLTRILTSPAFQASARRRVLLRFLIEEALAGRADRLKGFSIAVAVFGRDETFDSQSDPVVRLEARRLRRDLDGYYATAGRGDSVRITVPKGGYAPEFRWRDEGEAVGIDQAAEDELPVGDLGPESDADGSSETPAISFEQSARQERRKRLLRYGQFLLLGLLAVILSVHIFIDHRERSREEKRIALNGSQEHGPAIIVLPFESLSQQENDFHLAEGLTQQLVTDLMRFDAFRIYAGPEPPTHGTPADPLELAHSLPLSYIVTGSVRSEGEFVRVSSQLIDGKSDEILWSETYNETLSADDLLHVQERLASEIATRLGQPYGIVQSIAAEQLSRRRPRTLSGYMCVLRVYAYRSHAEHGQQAQIEACLDEAVREDPDYAVAWALLGWLRIDAVALGLVEGDAAKKALDRARNEITRATNLEPKCPTVLQASAALAWYRGDHVLAGQLLGEALAANPNNPELMAQLGWRLAARGRWDEGLADLEKAIDRTISPPPWYFTPIALHDYLQGDYQQALTRAERAKDDGFGIGWALVAVSQAALGNREAADAALVQMSAMSPALARDPATFLRNQQFAEPIIEALVAGLRNAGWTPPPPPVSAGKG